MPGDTLRKLFRSILPQWKICFFSAITIGLLAHLYKITNWLPNWDSLVFRYDSQNMVSLGRWFLPVICSFSSFYDLPFLNGILAILFHALGAVLVCKILKVEKPISAFLIGGVIVSFPTVTSVMMYNYVVDAYGFAFLLSVLAALLLTDEKPRPIGASVLIALSAGIYQAYITVTIMLILLKLIDEIIYHDAGFRPILKRSLISLLSGILGVVLYAVTLVLALRITDAELLEYQGISSTASLSGFNLAASLYTVKETFTNCFFDWSKGTNAYLILNTTVMAFTLLHYGKYIVKNKVYKRPATLLLLLVLCIALVLGSCALAFINAEVDYHNLMLMGCSIFYLFFLALYERGTDSPKITAAKRWAVLLIASAIICNQIVIANVSYHKAQLAYEKSYGVIIRIADRIEQNPETEACTKLLVVGALENSEQYSVNLTPNITGITDGYIIRADDETVGQSVLCSALNDYCGKNYDFVSGKYRDAMLEKEEIRSMKKWPAKESVAVIDNVIVIKLSTEGEQ